MTIKILKHLGFTGGNVDPCLYVKKNAKAIEYAALYIDDNLRLGDIKAIDNAITALKNNGLVLKVMEEVRDYLSCKVKFSEDKRRAWLQQTHLIKIWKRNLMSICTMFRIIILQVCLNV